jgi:hypothetical protein
MTGCRMIGLLMMLAPFLAALEAKAIDYNVPEPEQRFGGKGWLTQTGNDHGIHFKAYLETKRLIIAEDGIYYEGTQRVEGVDGDPHGYLRWRYRARCAVPPSKKSTVPVGIWAWDAKSNFRADNFIEVDPRSDEASSNASRGWYNLWWAVCRGQAKSFF